MKTQRTVIFETDFCTDVDDVGALVLLADAASRKEICLAGVSVNVPGSDKAPAVRALLEQYGLTDTPVAVWKGFPPASGTKSAYTPFLADICSVDGKAAPVPGPDEFYKKLLEAAPDSGVEIVSVGFFTGLADAIRKHPELFRQKVSRVYAMAGSFGSKGAYAEFNVAQDPASAGAFLSAYDGEVIFLPSETGEPVFTDLNGTPVGTLTRECYRLYTDGSLRRSSWDPLTADLALNGIGDRLILSEPGRVAVTPEGYTLFTPDAGGRCRWVAPAKTPEELGAYITDKIVKAMR